MTSGWESTLQELARKVGHEGMKVNLLEVTGQLGAIFHQLKNILFAPIIRKESRKRTRHQDVRTQLYLCDSSNCH
jgi:hypothetical protein